MFAVWEKSGVTTVCFVVLVPVYYKTLTIQSTVKPLLLLVLTATYLVDRFFHWTPVVKLD